MFDFITLCDGYKLDHRRQYPKHTQFVYSNFTPRSSRIDGQNDVVFFGLQYFLRRYLLEKAQHTFFDVPKAIVVRKYAQLLDSYFGPNDIGTEHIAALHDLGYIPLEFCALPEGTRVPLRMPMFTVENTHPDFFWVTNYIETLLSCALWQACTSATTALRYRKLLDSFAEATGKLDAVPYQAHDFSFRGQTSVESAALSGAGHLLSFLGTDSLPAIQLLRDYYHGGRDGETIGVSVPATEHSVMCAGGEESEKHTFERLLDLYPKGIVSVVSDTWDLFHVIERTLPALRDKILARDGKLVIRPDSGDPVKILCGDPRAPSGTAEWRGVVEALWVEFGGDTNAKGYIELDSHIGAIYGDSITEERAREICERLKAKGFASTNVVLGIGSYTYQYVTRDTYGFAIKATHATIGGGEHFLCKTPKTDDGTKNSARGRILIDMRLDGSLRMTDGLATGEMVLKHNLLRPVWRDGTFEHINSLGGIRNRLKSQS